MQFEKSYAKLIRQIIDHGELKHSRNGHTISVFGASLTFDLQVEFPILQGRKMFHKGVFGELAAMLRGPKHVDDFKAWGCNYWDKWAEADGSIRVDYGNAWLDFNGVNQLDLLKESLVGSPDSRRMVISGWRPGADLSLPCCHYAYQFYVREGRYLDMMWVQRSADTMVGVPSDAIFAAAWLIAICQQFTWLKPGRCVMHFGDTHIYKEHLDDVSDYLAMADTVNRYASWNCAIGPVQDFCEFTPEWIELAIPIKNPKIDFVLKD